MAHDAMGPTTALITLPNARSRFSPRELTGTFVTLFGIADPELLDHEGKSFRDRETQRTLDPYGHSLSLFTDSPDDPGISNAWDSSDSYGASGGGSSRGA